MKPWHKALIAVGAAGGTGALALYWAKRAAAREQYTLTVNAQANTTPIAVPVTIDEHSLTTPGSLVLPEGTYYISAPDQIEVGGVTYYLVALPMSIALDRDQTITLTYEVTPPPVTPITPVPEYYTLTTSVSPSGSGFFDRARTDTGAVREYSAGSTIILAAYPAEGYRFSHWSGDISGAEELPAAYEAESLLRFTLDSDRTVIANYEPIAPVTPITPPPVTPVTTYIGFRAEPHGSGLIEVDGLGRVEAGELEKAVVGQVYRFTAYPNIGWRFSHWSGDVSGTEPTIDVMASPLYTNVIANFEPVPITPPPVTPTTPVPAEYRLTVDITPTGSGLVGLDGVSPRGPGGYVCRANDTIELEAYPAEGYSFSHWSGDVSGTSRTTTIIMDRNKSVTANFVVTPITPPPATP